MNIKNSRLKIQDSIKEFSPTSPKTTVGPMTPKGRSIRTLRRILRTIFNFQSSMRSNGFSFIELMTVVAIMAVLIAASMPMFRNFTRGKNLNEGTNMVISALRKTRNAAITERERYRTVFDNINHAVAIYVIDDDINPVENWRSLPEFIEINALTGTVRPFPPAVPSPGLFYVEFKTNGAANLAGSVTLLETSTSDTKQITFNNITGKIGVE